MLITAFFLFQFLTFPVPGELDIHHVPAGSRAVDRALVYSDERLAAAFAEANAPLFIRERFREANVDSTLERVESPDPFCGAILGAIDHFCVAGYEVKSLLTFMLLEQFIKLRAIDSVPLHFLAVGVIRLTRACLAVLRQLVK